MSDEFTPTPQQRKEAADQLWAVVRAAEAVECRSAPWSHPLDPSSKALVRTTCRQALDLYRAVEGTDWTGQFLTTEANNRLADLWLHSQMVIGLLSWSGQSESMRLPDDIVPALAPVFRNEAYERVKEIALMARELRPMVAAFAENRTTKDPRPVSLWPG